LHVNRNFFVADIVTNSKARRDYHITDTFEAGIVLRGTEVKADTLRAVVPALVTTT